MKIRLSELRGVIRSIIAESLNEAFDDDESFDMDDLEGEEDSRQLQFSGLILLIDKLVDNEKFMNALKEDKGLDLKKAVEVYKNKREEIFDAFKGSLDKAAIKQIKAKAVETATKEFEAEYDYFQTEVSKFLEEFSENFSEEFGEAFENLKENLSETKEKISEIFADADPTGNFASEEEEARASLMFVEQQFDRILGLFKEMKLAEPHEAATLDQKTLIQIDTIDEILRSVSSLLTLGVESLDTSKMDKTASKAFMIVKQINRLVDSLPEGIDGINVKLGLTEQLGQLVGQLVSFCKDKEFPLETVEGLSDLSGKTKEFERVLGDIRQGPEMRLRKTSEMPQEFLYSELKEEMGDALEKLDSVFAKLENRISTIASAYDSSKINDIVNRHLLDSETSDEDSALNFKIKGKTTYDLFTKEFKREFGETWRNVVTTVGQTVKDAVGKNLTGYFSADEIAKLLKFKAEEGKRNPIYQFTDMAIGKMAISHLAEKGGSMAEGLRKVIRKIIIEQL